MKHVKNLRIYWLVCLAVLLMSGTSSWAEWKESPVELEFHTTWAEKGSFEKAESSQVGIAMVGASMKAHDVTVGYDHIWFEWENANKLPFGDGVNEPWEELRKVSLSFDKTIMHTEKWGYFATAGLESCREEEVEDSFSGVLFGGAIRRIPKWNASFHFGGGVLYTPVDVTGIPALGVQWNTQAEKGVSISVGIPETNVSYRFNSETVVSLGLELGEGGVYRLANDSVVEKKGYLEIEGYKGVLALGFSPFKSCTIKLGATALFDRAYSLYDEDGKNEKEYELDDVMGLFFQLQYVFTPYWRA